MSAKKGIWVLVGVVVLSVWVFGSAMQAGAETRNLKYYTWTINRLSTPIADVEGHTIGLTVTGILYAFEDGEVASGTAYGMGDLIKNAGPFSQYININFTDGSTIIVKGQGTIGSTATGTSFGKAGMKNEFIKGTGRFEGIRGTVTAKMKYLPLEKGEAGPRGYGEATWTYTLPSK